MGEFKGGLLNTQPDIQSWQRAGKILLSTNTKTKVYGEILMLKQL